MELANKDECAAKTQIVITLECKQSLEEIVSCGIVDAVAIWEALDKHQRNFVKASQSA